jgi:hypothetical protein
MPYKDPEVARQKSQERYQQKRELWKNPDGSWKKAAPEARLRQWLAREYNMTPERYRHLLDEHGELCGICRKPSTGKRLSIDHDHACCSGARSCGQCVRGLLCSRCNLLLGNAGDSTELLEAMVAYLHWHSPSDNRES